MPKPVFCHALLNFWLCIAFACGIILGNSFTGFILFFVLGLISAGSAYFFYKKNYFLSSDISILILFLFLGALWQIPSSSLKIDKFLNQENICTIKVTSLPQKQTLRNSLFADLKDVHNLPFQQRVKVFDYTRSMGYLSSYKVTAKLTRKQYRGNGFYSLWVKSGSQPEELSLSFWDSWARKITYFLLDIYKNNLNDGSFRFLASVFLGHRELLSKDEAEIFKDAGIAHLLAISGSNIALAAAVLFFILQLFYVKFRPRLLISLFFLFIYTLVTGANPPVLRASLMYAIFALGYFLKRQINPFNSLGLAGLVCLIFNPFWLFDAGFQLSFLSIFALIFGFTLFPVKPSHMAVLTYSKYLFFSSLFVTLFITPLISYYFGRVYLLTVFYNVILIPFFTFILMLNFLLIICSLLPYFSQAAGALLSVLIPLFYNISRWLGSLKFSFVSFTFPVYLVYLYYFILASIFVFASARKFVTK